jgi:hypothetical protein
LDVDNGQRGSNIEECGGIKNFLDKRSTQVGEQAHEHWLVTFDMCIVMCLLALHKFFKLVCILVWCMLVVELEWWYEN